MNFRLEESIAKALRELPVVYRKRRSGAHPNTLAHIAKFFPCTMREYAARNNLTIAEANKRMDYWRSRGYVKKSGKKINTGFNRKALWVSLL